MPPSSEPISLTDAKTWLRVTQSAEDALVASLITAARMMVERYTRRSLGSQTWALALAGFPFGGVLELPMPPLRSVSSIAYYDVAGNVQALSGPTYTTASGGQIPGVVCLLPGNIWPPTQARPDAVTVTYLAGYGAGAEAVPSPLLAAMRLAMAYLYENRQGPNQNGNQGDLPPAFGCLCDPYTVHAL